MYTYACMYVWVCLLDICLIYWSPSPIVSSSICFLSETWFYSSLQLSRARVHSDCAFVSSSVDGCLGWFPYLALWTVLQEARMCCRLCGVRTWILKGAQSGPYSPSIHLLEELPIHLHSDCTHLHASPQWIWVPPPPRSCFLFLLMSLLTVMRWHFKVVLICISWVSLINLWAWSCHFWLCSLEVWKEGWIVCSQSVHSLLLKVLSLA